jgi:hypothetical protein
MTTTPQYLVRAVGSGGQLDINVLSPDDNVGYAFGTDSDAVFYLSSAIIEAADETTGLHAGTSVKQETAANSLIISNITDDGDIQMLVNDGGNSKEFLFADGSAENLVLGHGMATATVKTASGVLTLDSGAAINIEPASGSAILLDGTISIDAGLVTGATSVTIGSTIITDGVITDSSGLQLAAALDINGDIDMGNYDISNVGASGNVWNDAQFIHKGTGNIVFQRSTSGTSAESRVFDLIHNSTGNVADGSGPAFTFRQNDDDGGEEELGRISFVRAGADNTGDFRVSPTITGGSNLALTLTSVGVLGVDLSGSGSAAQVDLFDQYDDATELQRFAYSGEGVEDVVPEVTEEQRLANRERMVEMGIITPVPEAASGYHMQIQPLTRLLAGGIYQNRHRMDSQYEELHKRLEAIGA